MQYEIIREPNILMESVGMLYRYVNGISMQGNLKNARERVSPEVFEQLNRREGWIQEIMYKVCKGLDHTNPLMQKYFKKLDLETASTCLACYMTDFLYLSPRVETFDESVEGLRKHWRYIREQDLRISPNGNASYGFSKDPSLPKDLFRQIKAMNLPAEFKLELYEALSDYDSSILQLQQLVEPYARKLEECYRENSWLMDETVEHWQQQFQKVGPLEFIVKCAGQEFVNEAAEKTVVRFSLMNSHQVGFEIPTVTCDMPECNTIYFGACLTTEAVTKKRTRDQEFVSSALKYLGDKRRLEVLRRLHLDRGYGGDLAESMGIDSSNMYRMLTQLHQFGFLEQEEGPWKNYYRTNPQAFRAFLRQVEQMVLGETIGT